jgi:hypothetical protein
MQIKLIYLLMKINSKDHFKLRSLDSNILAQLFNTNKKEVDEYCGKLIKSKNIRYRPISFYEYKKIILQIIEKIEKDNQNVLSKKRKKVWLDGWRENFLEFKKKNSSLSLIPKYYLKRPNKIFRLGGKFVAASQKNFEYTLLEIYRLWFFKKFFAKANSIYEFGVGSASNLNHAAEIFPLKYCYGLDFVQSSVDLVNLLSSRLRNKNIKGILFNMLRPNKNLKINNDSAFFSVGAYEQLGNNIDKILDFWIKKKPQICLNIEPDICFYNKKIPEDYLAFKFHKQRNYTSCLYKKLKRLENNGKIKIIKKFRSPFGNYVFDAYNFFLWKVI